MPNKLMFLPYCVLIAVLGFAARADVAPPSGQTAVRTDLTILTKGDVSEYRFFLDFAGYLSEVEIKNDSQAVLEPNGGGARFNRGTLYAVPRIALAEFPDKITPDKGENFSRMLAQGELKDAAKLLEYKFTSIISLSEREFFSYPTYILEKDGKSLKITENLRINPKVSDEELTVGGVNFSVYGIKKEFAPLFYILAGAVIIAIVFSIIFFSRARKNN